MGRGLRIGFPAPGTYNLAAAQGSYALSGQAAALAYSGNPSTGILTLTGSGFGTKPTAAPLIFQPFTDTTQGANYAACGFDFLGGNDQSSSVNYCDMADGVGGGSFLHDCASGSERFNHVGHYLSNLDQVLVSYWLRVRRVGSTNSNHLDAQFKGIRVACGSTSDTTAMYGNTPKYNFSAFWDNTTLAGGEPAGHYYVTGGSETGDFTNGPTFNSTNLCNDAWWYIETDYELNSVGSANGVQRILYIDPTKGTVQHYNVTNRQIRTLANEHFTFVMYTPGMANDPSATAADIPHYEVRLSRIYADNSRMRIFLGNASTLSACTGRFMLPPITWGDTVITATAHGIPSGYNWAYVSNASNVINSSGLTSFSVS